MSRARATTLALVNWKGVFYERYRLDRHVTALEGSNGAGKTTVMIAAYVVLLPDMARLRFTNLGESGATGGDKGVFGRLGQRGRPSYAAMGIDVPGGKPLVAIIHLERKADPTVELTPMLVTGIASDGPLRDLLLVRDGEDEGVPELSELRANVSRLGGHIDVFGSAKEYFAALFERGVMPLRMATDEDRNKLNDLLRTSMSGGISRALTTELRGFVLKEETGLGDALARMRANLDTCHRTRVEVGEARRLEREISSVFDAGQAMFAAAMLSVRAEANETAKRAADARRAFDQAREPVRALDDALSEAARRHEIHVRRLAAVRTAYDDAVATVEGLARARALCEKLEAVTTQRSLASSRAEALQAARRTAALAREAKRGLRDTAREAYDRSAAGLADLQRGLDELHKNAHAQRRARRLLEEARQLIGIPTLDEDGLDEALAHARERLARLDIDRAHADRESQAHGVRQLEYARASSALGILVPGVPVERAHPEARRALARLAELDVLFSRLPELAAEREQAAALARRQAATRALGDGLGLELSGMPAAVAVRERLSDAESEVSVADEGARNAAARADDAYRALEAARQHLAVLERGLSLHHEAAATAARIEAALGMPIRSRESLAQARERVAADREGSRDRAAALRAERDEVARAAAALDSSANTKPELVRLCEDLDGELLAARFEDVDASDAARVEARLGELVDAIVVADPLAAARKVGHRSGDLSCVWLVAADAQMGPFLEGEGGQGEAGSATNEGRDLFVESGFGIRVTRLSDKPTIGRRARERRLGELRQKVDDLDGATARFRQDMCGADALLRDCERLAANVATLEGGDPADAIARTRAEIDAMAASHGEWVDAARSLRLRAADARPRVEALRSLLGDAFLLDPPDQAERLRDLGDALTRAHAARDELRRVEAPRRILSELVDALRAPPVGEDDVAKLASLRAELDCERARLFRLSEALSELSMTRSALGRGDAETALLAHQGVVPALEVQLVRARDAMRAEEEALREAEAAWETATQESQKADGELALIEAQRAGVVVELAAVHAGDASDASLQAARRAASDLRAERDAEERDERRLLTEIALLRERRAHAERALQAAQSLAEFEERQGAPAAALWLRASKAAEEAGVLRDGLALGRPELAESYAGHPSATLRLEFASRAEVLIDRLGTSRGGSECIPIIRESTRPNGTPTTDAHLTAWLGVRDWVQRRLPAPLANLPEPLAALERLRDDLKMLEELLTRQETDLRGVSGDVAQGIDVQLRRASHQVRRLNRNLDGVRFGSIAGIRVQMQRVERMDQVLVALRNGAVQELLFQPSMPIEDALDEIFRRYGGGRSGGQRILDYREYLHLTVEIQRQVNGDWEPASPARLSTGEAIGVGSALIMVILTEWERTAGLLRANAKRTAGSLRFLLLDEANRLSQDNLGVLFDLCRTLDVQLLIAAPEVARAEGNTTYRLVRRVTDKGGEEVIVSGRRTVASSP